MTDPINLTQLRATANQWGSPYAVSLDSTILLALIDTAEAAREVSGVFWRMNRRTRGVAPSEDIGPEWGQMQAVTAKLRESLARYTTD